MSNKKLKNKYVTVEDMSELLELVSLINLKVEANKVLILSRTNYPDYVDIKTGVHESIEILKHKIKNT